MCKKEPHGSKKLKKIAIVGTASSFKDAPFFDDDWEVWALIGVYGLIDEQKKQRVTRWFEIHPFDILIRENQTPIEYFSKQLHGLGDKLTIFKPENLTPNATILRKEELYAAFGKYFTSSIAWCLGEAILEKPDQVGLWGVHCNGTNEYAEQRAAIEGYLRFLSGMGVPVYVHPNSSLFKAPLYCTEEFMRIKKAKNEAKTKSQQAFDAAQFWTGVEHAYTMMQGGRGG